MILILQSSRTQLTYAVFTTENELVFEGVTPIEAWTAKNLDAVFRGNILNSLRGQSKIFTEVGLIVPFAGPQYSAPIEANRTVVQKLASSGVEQRRLEPTRLLFEAVAKQWPHIPKYFLFDTCLSSQLPRYSTNLALPYDVLKGFDVHPVLLNSYGHRANVKKIKSNQSALSLVIADQTSLALFDGQHVKDAIVGSSSFSPLASLYSAGDFDAGFFLNIADKKRVREIEALLAERSGVLPMVEVREAFDTLLEISGIVPRKSGESLDALSIETIEWIEIAMRGFVRSIRHAIGALATADVEAKTLVVTSSVIADTSPFWNVITAGSLSHLKVVFSPVSPLVIASEDLNSVA